MPTTYEPGQPCTIQMPDGTYAAVIVSRNGDKVDEWIVRLTTEGKGK